MLPHIVAIHVLLALVLAAQSAQCAEDPPVKILENDKYELFYRPSSVKAEGGQVRAVLGWVYRAPQKQDDVTYFTSVETVVVSCEGKNLKVLEYALLDKAGKSLMSKRVDKDVSGNLAAKIATTLCAAAQKKAEQPKAAESGPQQGSGCLINKKGYVLSCYHVLEGKKKFTGYVNEQSFPLTLVRADKKNDLAVLKADSTGHPVIAFKQGKSIRLGEHCVALGYPLQGILSKEVNITSGQVSAMSGPGNDIRLLQVSAPIQPGNSGGPLLGPSGQLCGIIISKLNALKLAEVTGDIAQNIGFALNGQLIKLFLDSYNIEYEETEQGQPLPDAEIASTYSNAVVLIVAE